jgi:hypothetical protein
MNHSRNKLFLAVALLCGIALLFAPHTMQAEEGSSGHYFPGSISDFADSVPAAPTFIVRYNQIYYSGAIAKNKAIPIGGTTALGLEATSWGEGITLVWRPSIDMGKHWSYAMSATIPFMQMSVSASAVVPIPTGNGTSLLTTVARTGTRNALGDVLVMPFMINYAVNLNFNVNDRIGVFLPTGDYAVGRLANTGKNYTTLEPELGLQYFGQKNGREAVLYTGFDFNTINSATQYQTGTQFHLDGTLAQHLPLFKGLAGIGVNPFYYQQITGDSGPGATLGKFEGTTAGIGPVLSYLKPKNPKTGHVDFIADLKWLNEFYVKNRLQGNTVFVKILFKF